MSQVAEDEHGAEIQVSFPRRVEEIVPLGRIDDNRIQPFLGNPGVKDEISLQLPDRIRIHFS